MGGSAGVSCLFCRWTDTNTHSVLFASDRFYARWDNYPATVGHVEVVPKDHIVSFFDLVPDMAMEMFSVICEAQGIVAATFPVDGWTIGVNDGEAAGRTVHHLHVHLIPRRMGDVLDPRGGVRRIFPDDTYRGRQ